MDDLARRPPRDRAAIFGRAAEDRGLPFQHVEKDFWVCWLLRRLFTPPLVDGMVFKGGTSLSKVWDAIQRFSEDIDLTLPRAGIPGAAAVELLDEQSVAKRKRACESLRGILVEWCAGPGCHAISARIENALAKGQAWAIHPRNDTIEFEYPFGLPRDAYGGGYIRPVVRLEFGLLMPTEPAEESRVRPYAIRAGAYAMADSEVAVRVLAAERTFWEKVTLVHAENGRAGLKANGDRLSRHYADVATLARHEVGQRALARIDLLPSVARDKHRAFYTAWADYQAAAQGRLRLVPPPEKQKALQSNYAAMREMYFTEPMPFDTIVARLAELQEAVALHPLLRHDVAPW